MGREGSNTEVGTTGLDPMMPHNLQEGKMPSVEPEVGSPSSASSTSDLPKAPLSNSSPRISDELNVPLPSPESNMSTTVPDVDEDAELMDFVPQRLKDLSAGYEPTGVGSNYKPDRDFNTRRPSLPQGDLKAFNDGAAGKKKKLTAFEHVSQELSDDKKTLKEITLGRRVGFYRIRTDLGSGNFAQVKMAIHALTREKVAVKIMDKARLDQKTQRLVAREIANMERVHHPNIVRLYEVVETLAKLYLVMEYAGGGELFTKITNDGRLKESEAMPLLAQVIAAIDHLHSMDIIHRDLKAENVFFSGPNTIKVGDFGFSTISQQEQMLTTFCGSPPYAAPELLHAESYSGRPVDMWALGIMMYFMVTGMLPFRGESVRKLKRAILKGVYTVPTYLSASCVDLITALLLPVAAERPTVQDIRRFQWLHGAIYPNPLKAFSVNPDDGMNAGLLPDEERQARKVLSEMGITYDVIQTSHGKQARSSITGTYRIVLHRIQKQALGIQNEEFGHTVADASESVPVLYQPPIITAKKRFSLRGRINQDWTYNNPGGHQVSRLCVIL